VHQTVSCAQAGAPSELATLGKTKRSTVKIHRIVRCASDCPVSPGPTVIFANSRLPRDCHADRKDKRSEGVRESQSHRTVRCATGADESNGRLACRHRTPNSVVSGVSVDRKLMFSVQRLYGGWSLNTTPTDHFKVWEPKQHIKAYSRHTQALQTTSIH
jgi:hypothetical protein